MGFVRGSHLFSEDRIFTTLTMFDATASLYLWWRSTLRIMVDLQKFLNLSTYVLDILCMGWHLPFFTFFIIFHISSAATLRSSKTFVSSYMKTFCNGSITLSGSLVKTSKSSTTEQQWTHNSLPCHTSLDRCQQFKIPLIAGYQQVYNATQHHLFLSHIALFQQWISNWRSCQILVLQSHISILCYKGLDVCASNICCHNL